MATMAMSIWFVSASLVFSSVSAATQSKSPNVDLYKLLYIYIMSCVCVCVCATYHCEMYSFADDVCLLHSKFYHLVMNNWSLGSLFVYVFTLLIDAKCGPPLPVA